MEIYRVGRRRYGCFLETSRGTVYIAFRKPNDIYRKGKDGKFHNTISVSMEIGAAAWAIDETTLLMCRHRKIEIIGVWCKTLASCWVTRMDNYFDFRLCHMRDHTTRGGSRQRFLPLIHFRRCHWKPKI